MFLLSLPRWVYALLAVVVLIVGTYFHGYSKGWGDRDTEMQLEIAKKNEEAREKEQAMAKVVAEKETELRKANDVVSQKQTDLNRLIASGRVRFPTASCPQAAASAPTASGNSDQAPSQPDRSPDPDTGASESERQTLQLIAQIAADGDKAINQLNACIDAYDNMRNIINGQR
jgi:hypothetical protein